MFCTFCYCLVGQKEYQYDNDRKKLEGGFILGIFEEMIKVGQTMGFSMDGCANDMEKIIETQGVDGETKSDNISDMVIKNLWGNSLFEDVVSEANDQASSYFYLRPHAVSLKRKLWSYLTSLINRWNGECIVMGDFNEVGRKEDRWGTAFNVFGTRFFNQFISSAGLVEIQLEGYNFTWAHPSASKMSKLDRFLVSDGLLSIFPHLSAVCLDRHLFDHRPILLREVNVDYGATPFRFFHSWIDFPGFDLMVKQKWESITLYDKNGMIRFKKKLQFLKKEIRAWIADHKKRQTSNTHILKSKLSDIDKSLDKGDNASNLMELREEIVNQLQDVQNTSTRDFIQKVKIQWAVEGDENSKFFHEEFRNHFAFRFNDPGPRSGFINYVFPNQLNADQVSELEKPISKEEIRLAVRGCGENKSPGPDGFTFEFFLLVSPISCPICLAGLEDLDHLLFRCNMAAEVLRAVCKWWNLAWSPLDSYSTWLSWFSSIRMLSQLKSVLE
nr:RNA-directed DNA polymerase, eukaryota [Tanacetum cinerariifolium]